MVVVVRVNATCGTVGHLTDLATPFDTPTPMPGMDSFSTGCNELALLSAHTRRPARVRSTTRMDCHRIVCAMKVISHGTASDAAVHITSLSTSIVATAVHQNCRT